ncbi:hypothetical protein FHS23_004609 [Prauserella isguenensis]|uniref:Uncharacterized protein n=1 Tax=Prauserella isguenensis TaxID=1470180 RepID=A0A839S6Q7_9PSEU|nr:hypothetical protein [Prauserella isguenensis]MBB3053555.1 hypothetical protein [Prauserella isguenensis]
MWSLLVAAAIGLVLVAATAGAALAWHLRRARPHTTEPAPYEPLSVDPRGRWRISRIDDAALEPVPYQLDTDSDDAAEPLRPAAKPPRTPEH